MSTQLSPQTSEAHSTVGSPAADQQLLAMGRRLNELLLAVAPFVKLFNQAAAREDKPMLTNGTTEAVIANKDLRRLAYAAEDAMAVQSAQTAQAAPALPDPQGCNACSHPTCARFNGPRSVECSAMADNACARNDHPERQQREASNVSTGPAAPGWTSEEIEEVIACLDDDAANMLAENPEDERAPIMQRAACMVKVFSTLATDAAAQQETLRLGAEPGRAEHAGQAVDGDSSRFGRCVTGLWDQPRAPLARSKKGENRHEEGEPRGVGRAGAVPKDPTERPQQSRFEA